MSEKSSRTDFARLDAMKDEDIDFSDIPEITPEMMANAVHNWRPGQPLPRRRGRPTLNSEQDGDAPVTSVRFPPTLLEKLRTAASTEGIGIGEFIRRAVEHELAR